ncbi:hypothetical protein [Streptomyces hokutonensis]|uniref:hypothetical protein n=1 Tax=Streptomyces hokutonensis TaxID=1306990 RepID=UPI003676E3E9
MPDSDFGYTAWGKDWVRLAEPLRQTRPDPQLPRARGLARAGKVEITIDDRTVRALVLHGRNAFTASIELTPMPPETTAAITRRLSGTRPALTDDLYRTLTDEGRRPAPHIAAIDCTCPAATPRCVHALAAYYEMARRVDDDPRVALDAQGYFRAASQSAGVTTPAPPQRWIALNALEPDDYF